MFLIGGLILSCSVFDLLFLNDGVVNVGDLGILGANYGTSYVLGGSSGNGVVPEPATAALVLSGAVAYEIARSRNRDKRDKREGIESKI